MATRCFFFYGTLQPGCGTRMAQWLEPRLGMCRRASVPGALYSIQGGNGWYPALLPGLPWQRAFGTLCEVRLGPGDLALLDRYEGREYRRALLSARIAGGPTVQAQAYRWRGPAPKDALPLAAGDFLDWLSATRRVPFTTRRNGI